MKSRQDTVILLELCESQDAWDDIEDDVTADNGGSLPDWWDTYVIRSGLYKMKQKGWEA